MRKSWVAVIFLLFAPAAGAAEGFNPASFYLGGGFSDNDIDTSGFDDATGWQIFVGYDLPVKLKDITLGVEAGYWDSGDFDPGDNADGLWATGVGRLHLNRTIDLIARAGFDFGDDDGFMFGLGVGFNLNPRMQIRAEFVQRDETDSLQANFVFYLR